MIRLRLALNFFSVRLCSQAGSGVIHSCFQFAGSVYSSPAKAVSSSTRAFPARSQLPEVRTMPPSQREENWRSAMPWGENSALRIGSKKCSEP
ncbi:Uncharacterised protein [Klebsiella pneumoniae]|nr:Uncharacterised protein [Klebsiella pneumoniae]